MSETERLKKGAIGIKQIRRRKGFQFCFEPATLEEAKKIISDLESDEDVEINEAWWERFDEKTQKREVVKLVPWKGPIY